MKENSMQNVKFQKVSELLGFLPEDQLVVVEQLRELVFETLPNIKEKLSFNVPFFRLHKGICFIWPGAVSWGSKTWNGVEFGFNYGNLLADEMNYLEKGNRKQVFSKRFCSVEDINDEILRSYLLEAAELDDLMFREKMTNKKGK